MLINNIKDYQVYKANILEFKLNIKFDVVASFGLIEHFIDPTPYITKMASLVKRGGYLIIHVPNFRNFQYLIHLLSDRQLLEKHYLEYMDAGKLEKLVTRICPIKTLYAGYYGIIQDFPYKKTFPYNFLNFLSHNFNVITNRFSLNTLFSNRWTSPDTVYIGRKL